MSPAREPIEADLLIAQRCLADLRRQRSLAILERLAEHGVDRTSELAGREAEPEVLRDLERQLPERELDRRFATFGEATRRDRAAREPVVTLFGRDEPPTDAGRAGVDVRDASILLPARSATAPPDDAASPCGLCPRPGLERSTRDGTEALSCARPPAARPVCPHEPDGPGTARGRVHAARPEALLAVPAGDRAARRSSPTSRR